MTDRDQLAKFIKDIIEDRCSTSGQVVVSCAAYAIIDNILAIKREIVRLRADL